MDKIRLFLEILNSEIAQGLAAIIVSILTFILTNVLKNKKFSQAYRPKKLKKSERKNTILVIGLGRVGKSQMIETLFKQFPVVSCEETNNFYIHEAEKKFNPTTIRFVLTDYRGQNFAQLIQSFIEEQLRPNTKLRYGDINSLILVTDIFQDEKDEYKKRYDDIEFERIKEHVTQWNRTALDAVFGLMTKESLQYVCLFINKKDKLNQYSPEIEKKLLEQFMDLSIGLKTRAEKSSAKFETIIGSALTGECMIGPDSISKSLNKYSIPLKN